MAGILLIVVIIFAVIIVAFFWRVWVVNSTEEWERQNLAEIEQEYAEMRNRDRDRNLKERK